MHLLGTDKNLWKTKYFAHFEICSKEYKDQRGFFVCLFVSLVFVKAGKFLKQQYGMFGSSMPKRHKHENKHVSVSGKKQPLNFQHSFHFIAKIRLSKCNLVAKKSRGEQLRNMSRLL